MPYIPPENIKLVTNLGLMLKTEFTSMSLIGTGG